MATPVEQFEGKYEILEKIAEGGMGAVYKVRHRLLDVVRVIKVMRPHLEAQKGTRERFLREARLAIKMRHTNIAQLDDFSMDDNGNAFIVMEFIDGVTLQEYLQRFGPPPLPLALEIARQALLALGYLHRKKVIHRDISPDNLMVAADENGECLIKLIDLGIAKALQADAAGLTATGMFVGKVRYASPEHFRTEEGVEIDRWSDLYSLGLVLYELLTGKHPISGDTFSTLIAGHLFRPPLSFDDSDPDGRVPEDLRTIVLKALEKDPKDRFQDAGAFSKAIAVLQKQLPLEQELFHKAFGRLSQDPPTLRMQRPGSTQDRLDLEFKAGKTTPAPDKGSSVADLETGRTLPPVQEVETSGAPPAVAEQSGALVKAARHLVDLKMYKEARVQVSSLLQFDEGNSEAAELLARIDHEEARAEALAEAKAGGEQLLDTGALEKARECVAAAITEHDGASELGSLLARIDEARESARAEAVGKLLEQARILAGADHYDEAIKRLDEAARIDQQSTSVKRELSAVHDAKAAYDEAKRRAAKLTALMAEARGHLDSGEHREAVVKLQEAHELQPEDQEISRQLDDAREALRMREEEKQRAAQAAVLAGRAKKLLAKKKAAAAVAELEEAVQLNPGDSGLQQALAEARALLEEQQQTEAREKRKEALSSEAEALINNDEYRAAAEMLNQALELAPNDKSLRRRLKVAEREAQKYEDALARSAAINEVIESVDGMLDNQDFDRALESLDAADARLGEADDLADARLRVVGAEQKWRAARIEALSREAQSLLAEADFKRAVRRLEQGLELDPDNTGILAQLEDSRAAQAKQVQRRGREAAATAAEKLLADEDFDQALATVSKAIDEFGTSDDLHELGERIKALATLADTAGEAADDDAVSAPRRSSEVPTERLHEEVVAAGVAGGDPQSRVGEVELESDGAETTPSLPEAPPHEAPKQPVATTVVARPDTTSARRDETAARRPPLLLIGGAAVVLIIAVILFLALRGERDGGGVASQSGALVIRALPWAEVVGVVDSEGAAVELPEQAYTPLRLPLPEGGYRVTLKHGSSPQDEVREVRVSAGETVDLLVDFARPEVDDFLAAYGVAP